MFEAIGVGIIFVLICVYVAYHAADVLATFGAPIQEWFNKKYGFPRNVKTGPEGLLNKKAKAITKFIEDSESGYMFGKLNIHGEIWLAKSSSLSVERIEIGDEVLVTGVEGLILEVEAIAEQHAQQ